MADNTDRIRAQNDRFRQCDGTIPGSVVVTQGLAAHLAETGIEMQAVSLIIAIYNDFTEENDPWGQHDFGMFTLGGERCYWKIDYYDSDLAGGSEGPSDLTQTHRVLTIMLAQDY